MTVTKPYILPKIAVPLERCYWVVDNLLLAGAYPGHPNSQAHRTRISGLWGAGMRTFINLMEEDETDHARQAFVRYDDVLRELALKNSDHIAHLRFPIPDTKITTLDRMRSILDAIDLSFNNKIPVYVHCFGGMGRTGTVICCWLLRHGLASKDNVWSLLTALRKADLPRATRPAPENDAQCKFVLDWPEQGQAVPRLKTTNGNQETKAKSNPLSRNTRTSDGNWFERLFGFAESNREAVYRELEVVDNRLRSINSGEEWICGNLEIASLEDLRNRIQILPKSTGQLKLTEFVGDAKSLHQDPANTGALFQVASQFNLLEMASQHTTPEQGITIYEHDRTQGPTCAIACAAGTVYRNYFVDVDGQTGQTTSKQVDCLAAIGEALGNTHGRLWKMKNGYALPSDEGLTEVDGALGKMSEQELDQLRAKLRIGLQWQTEVTLAGCNHLVSQAYCSALPIGYSDCSPKLWKRFATLVLEASYEATLSAAVINAAATGNNCLFLTLVGGGVFANNESWILSAIRRACKLHHNFDLDVKIVSFRSSHAAVRELAGDFQ